MQRTRKPAEYIGLWGADAMEPGEAAPEQEWGPMVSNPRNLVSRVVAVRTTPSPTPGPHAPLLLVSDLHGSVSKKCKSRGWREKMISTRPPGFLIDYLGNCGKNTTKRHKVDTL